MLHDMDTGKPKTFRAGPNREVKYYTAETGHKAPCRTGWKCPKGTPETAHEKVLSERNRRTVKIYEVARATGYQYVPEFDSVLADNFRIIDRQMRAFERGEQADLAAIGLMKVLPTLKDRA